MIRVRPSRHEKDHSGHLEEAAATGEIVQDFRRHPGWEIVQRVLNDYRQRRYTEFLQGSAIPEEYRVECRILDWLDGVLEASAENGELAAQELQKRGWK